MFAETVYVIVWFSIFPPILTFPFPSAFVFIVFCAPKDVWILNPYPSIPANVDESTACIPNSNVSSV